MRSRALLVLAVAFAAGLIVFALMLLETTEPSPAHVQPVAAPTDEQPRNESVAAPAPMEATTPRAAAPRTADPREARARTSEAAPRRSVAIVVTDTVGEPIEDARVRTSDDDFESALRTDPDGRCSARVTPGRELDVHVDADGHHHSSSRWSDPSEVSVRLFAVASVKGRVLTLDGSAPVAGADVALRYDDCGLCVVPSAVSDGVGAFELERVPVRARATVEAFADGYVPGDRTFVLRDEEAQLELRLDRGVELWLEVVDFETGAPIQGAVVKRGKAEIDVPPSGRLRSAELIGTEEGEEELRMFVQADGYCRLDFSVDPRTLGQGEMMQLRLPRGVTIEGVARDGSGNAPTGATAGVLEDKNLQARERSRKKEGSLPTTPLDEVPKDWRYRMTRDRDLIVVNADGSFEIGGVVPWSGFTRVWATADDHSVAEELVQAGPPGSVQPLELTLQSEITGAVGAVRGRMTLNGEALPGVIEWIGVNGDGVALTDADGAFVIERVETGLVRLDPHPYAFDHLDEACAGLSQERGWSVEVVEGETSTLDVAFAVEMATISGRVLGSGEQPMAHVEVAASADGACFRSHSIETAADGSFEIEVDARFPAYTVEARGGPAPVERTNVAPGSTDVVLELSDLSRLRFRVVDRDDGRALSRPRLLWRRPGDDRYRNYTHGRGVADPEGWLEVEFAPGLYDLGVSMARTEPEYLPDFADGVVLGDELRTLVFEVEHGIELELRLGGEKGRKNAKKKRPWPNDVTVLLVDVEYLDAIQYKSSRSSFKWGVELVGTDPLNTWKVEFDKLGTARVTALRPGRHRFRSYPAGIAIHPAEVMVRPGMDPLEIRWSRK